MNSRYFFIIIEILFLVVTPVVMILTAVLGGEDDIIPTAGIIVAFALFVIILKFLLIKCPHCKRRPKFEREKNYIEKLNNCALPCPHCGKNY